MSLDGRLLRIRRHRAHRCIGGHARNLRSISAQLTQEGVVAKGHVGPLLRNGDDAAHELPAVLLQIVGKRRAAGVPVGRLAGEEGAVELSGEAMG